MCVCVCVCVCVYIHVYVRASVCCEFYYSYVFDSLKKLAFSDKITPRVHGIGEKYKIGNRKEKKR